MNGLEQPWEELHHCSYFLPELEQIKCNEFRMTLTKKVFSLVMLLGTHGIYVEGSMSNLSPIIPINVSPTPSKVENICVGEDSSPNEIHTYTKFFK